jgi:hypothetical protein
VKEYERAIAVEVTGDDYRIVQEGEAFEDCDERIEITWPQELDAINDKLVSKGWPDTAPWWRKTIARSYLAGVRNIVIRGGRRGGKSTTVCRVAVYDTLYGNHDVPPGDVGYFAIISAEKGQAKERLLTIKKILETLGVDHKATAEQILITGTNLGFRIFTASLQGVVSFTCIGALCDEEARWRDDDTGANPAEEVLASLRPTMATQKNAKIWHVSSPWSTLDAHYKMVERGSAPDQIVFCAPTWEMNPTITEEETKILEPDELSRLREYAAIPMSGDLTKFFDAETIDACCKPIAGVSLLTAAGADFAFRKNSSALVVTDMLRGPEKRDRKTGDLKPEICYVVRKSEDRVPMPGAPLRVTDTIEEFADIAEACGADTLCADLHYIESVRETLENFSMTLIEFPNQTEKMNEAYIRVRVLLANGRIDLSKASPKLIDQLKATTSKPNSLGLTIEHPKVKGEHGDLVPALVAAVYSADLPDVRAATAGRRRFARYENVEGWREFAPTD